MSQNTPNVTTSRPHILCTACKSFWKRVTCLNFATEELSRGGESIPQLPEHVLHSRDRAKIKSAALSGCHFCSILIGSVLGCTGNHGYRTLFNDSDHDPIYVSFDILNHDAGTFLLTLFSCEQFKIFCHDQILNSSPSLRLCPTKNEYTPIAAIESEISSLQTSTFSKATANFINSWISECQNNHPLCGPDQFSLLHGDHVIPRPRRLLDVKAFQDSTKIQLVEAEDLPDVEYCALSYSWGFSKPYVLTSVNIVDFYQQIHVQELPKTIRDAIETVREIGYRYLWIDALCIMQDGRTCPSASEDWEDQAGKLNDIFSNSVITIAASESFDGETGFIKSRNPLSQIICRLQPETGLCYDVVPPCTPYCLAHPFNNAQYHLDTRAWVFQERILAPKTAHITRNFLHLECRTELVCETMQGSDACHHSGAVPKADYQNLFSVLGLELIEGLTIPELTVPFFLSTWHGLVRRYSMTNLSRSSDILVALAGLAKQIQTKSNFTWSFGLWREYLLRDLLWYVRGGKGIPARERAPSWSWASIKVRGPQILYEASVDIPPDARITSLPEISAFTSQAPLSDNESRYAIKLMVLMKAGAPHLKETSPADSHPNRVHRNCQGISKAHPECPFHPDYELPGDTKLYSILIARVSGADRGLDTFLQSDEIEIGLVLTPLRGFQGRYRRVGYFHRTLHLQFQPDGFADRRQPSLFDEHAQIQEIEVV